MHISLIGNAHAPCAKDCGNDAEVDVQDIGINFPLCGSCLGDRLTDWLEQLRKDGEVVQLEVSH
jgi:hypothetical protein